MSYSSYTRNSTFPPPAPPAPVLPCPEGAPASMYWDTSGPIDLVLGEFNQTASLTLNQHIGAPGYNVSGSPYPPCQQEFITNGDPETWTLGMSETNGGPPIVPALEDTEHGGLFNLYQFNCTDLAASPLTRWLTTTNTVGTQYTGVTINITDPFAGCP